MTGSSIRASSSSFDGLFVLCEVSSGSARARVCVYVRDVIRTYQSMKLRVKKKIKIREKKKKTFRETLSSLQVGHSFNFVYE